MNWKAIQGYEGHYEVSDEGYVRSIKKDPPLNLKLNLANTGYRVVNLWLEGESKTHQVHRLVLEAFVGPCPKGKMGLHWDDDKDNNRLSNLRWGSRSENARDSVRNGIHHESVKVECSRGHALKGANLREGSLKVGRRDCKACSRERETARREGREFSIEESNIRYEEVMAGVAKPHANQYTRSKERM